VLRHGNAVDGSREGVKAIHQPFEDLTRESFGEGSGRAAEELRKASVASIQPPRDAPWSISSRALRRHS
jgi:hypothetical protein